VDRVVRVTLWLLAQTPSPSASFVVEPPPAGPAETVGAVVAIALAVAAAILGYRIIRGGKGL
jgi:hypothetical protein